MPNSRQDLRLLVLLCTLQISCFCLSHPSLPSASRHGTVISMARSWSEVRQRINCDAAQTPRPYGASPQPVSRCSGRLFVHQSARAYTNLLQQKNTVQKLHFQLLPTTLIEYYSRYVATTACALPSHFFLSSLVFVSTCTSINEFPMPTIAIQMILCSRSRDSG